MPYMPTSYMTEPLKLAWIDSAKGICIILVVIGHAINGLATAGLWTPQSGGTLHYYIYSFHVPAFFFLSGLLVKTSIERHARGFLKNIGVRIAYPFVLWSVIQILIINALGSLLNYPTPFSISEFIDIFVSHVAQFWFLKTLLLLHLSFYCFTRLGGSDMLFLFAAVAMRGCTELFPMQETFLALCNYGLFYAFGIAASATFLNWPERLRWPLSCSLICCAIWMMFAAIAMQYQEPILFDRPLRGGLLPASITGTAFVVLLSGVPAIARSRVMGYIGRCAFPIFVLHVLCVAGIRIVFVKLLHVTNGELILPFAVAAGVIIPLICHEFAGKLGIRKVLGL
jgi:fucose 4-O-acetylase-like acetyltransferase